MKKKFSYQMDDCLKVTNIPGYFENFVFIDIEEEIILKGVSLDDHYQRVMSVAGGSYRAINKEIYGETLQAIKTIVECKKNNIDSESRIEAISFLHQNLKFSPSVIQRILLLLGVKMEITHILNDSEKIFVKTSEYKLMNKLLGEDK